MRYVIFGLGWNHGILTCLVVSLDAIEGKHSTQGLESNTCQAANTFAVI